MTTGGRAAMEYRTLERAAAHDGTAGLLDYALSVLDDVASGRRPMRGVRHPLGFFCLPALREDGYGVCVHLFEGGEPSPVDAPATSLMHSHSWELTSCVLYGRIGNVRLTVHDQPERPTHRIFEVHSAPSGVDEIRPTPRLVRCAAGPAQVTGRGRVYRLSAGEFHTTVVPDGAAAATLVLGRSVPGLTDLSLGPLGGTGHRIERRTCHATQTARIARAALRRMHEPHDTA
jgi:hypothetical protein